MEISERKPLDATAFGLMLVLCVIWGYQQVAIKLTVPDVSPVMQGALRSIIATALVVAWARFRGVPLFNRDGTLGAGTLAGLLFGVEFVFIYYGLAHTAASRMAVFIYLAPVLAALGLHLTVPGERLSGVQWVGVLVAFAGVATAFSEGFLAGQSTLLGDACGVIAAVLWAATTVTIRSTSLARIPATKTFFYQIGWAALVLLPASIAMGEPGVIAWTPLAIASLAYQGVIAGFASLLVWFWLLRHYMAARVGVLSFLTPMFGVVCGVVFLGEPLSGAFVVAALLVGAGIVLVNFRR